MNDQIFDKFRTRLTKEGWLKAAFCGLTVGFFALLVSAFVCWYTGYKAVWICAIIAVAAAAIAVPVFFFALFRPSEKALARRMDGLGLEERVITMRELEGDDSFMAKRQRNDAISEIKKVDAKRIKIAVSVPLVIMLCVSVTLGSGMTVVSALSAAEVINPGHEILNPDDEPPVPTYTVTYEVDGDGYIEGDIVQIVDEGKDTEFVTAVPEEGFAFVGWMAEYLGADGNWYPIDELEGFDNPVRQDCAVSKDLTVIAVFMEADPDGEPDDGEEGEEGDNSSDQPSEGNEGPGQNKPTGENGGGVGGDWDDKANQIIDGDTFYGNDTLTDARGDAMGGRGDGDGDKGSIGDYYDIIQD